MKQRLLYIAAALLLLAISIYAAHRAAFDWHALAVELQHVSLLHISLAIACIYAGIWLRAVRWRVLIGPNQQIKSTSLVLPQFVGFTAVALFGRLADLARPYLVARRTGLPVASQIAVYSVERILDLAAAAVLFSVTLAFAPRNLPHHEAFARAGFLSLAATLSLGAIVLAIRFAGDRLAHFAAYALRPLSPAFATSASARILDFRAGLNTLRSFREFLSALLVSLVIWLGIAEAYVQSTHAFLTTPQLAAVTFTQTMLLMATSMGGSLVQLPVIGWFTQIALLAAALHKFFSAPVEAATACGAVMLFNTTLCLIPTGIVAARLSGTSLADAAQQAKESGVA